MNSVVGVGLDLVDVDRFARVMERRPRLVSRVFRSDEAMNRSPEGLAARFAVKEAVLKSLGVGLGSVRLSDIETVRASSGQPRLVLHGTAAELAAERGVTSWQISLSHTDRTAGAVVVALA
ncbi:MAG: holo-ACP synthase [Acidobacteria bacterium]|nr:holo-ACP synthase [Acidobacteriota bacterium]